MDFTFQQYEESAQAIRARLGGFAPKVAMILGSGLGYLGDQVEGAVTVPSARSLISNPPPPRGTRAGWSSALWRASGWR